MVEEMQKGGWDLNIVAPRPTVTCGRSDYMQILAKHESYRSAFSAVKSTRMPNEPDIRQIREGAKEKMIEAFVKDAEVSYKKYIAKLATKIGKEVLSAKIEGRMWEYSLLTVQTAEGTEVWKTQCILNESVLGKLFNQWPTRLMK